MERHIKLIKENIKQADWTAVLNGMAVFCFLLVDLNKSQKSLLNFEKALKLNSFSIETCQIFIQTTGKSVMFLL